MAELGSTQMNASSRPPNLFLKLIRFNLFSIDNNELCKNIAWVRVAYLIKGCHISIQLQLNAALSTKDQPTQIHKPLTGTLVSSILALASSHFPKEDRYRN